MNDEQVYDLLEILNEITRDFDPDETGLPLWAREKELTSAVRSWLLRMAQPNSPYGFLILSIPDKWIQTP